MIDQKIKPWDLQWWVDTPWINQVYWTDGSGNLWFIDQTSLSTWWVSLSGSGNLFTFTSSTSTSSSSWEVTVWTITHNLWSNAVSIDINARVFLWSSTIEGTWRFVDWNYSSLFFETNGNASTWPHFLRTDSIFSGQNGGGPLVRLVIRNNNANSFDLVRLQSSWNQTVSPLRISWKIYT